MQLPVVALVLASSWRPLFAFAGLDRTNVRRSLGRGPAKKVGAALADSNATFQKRSTELARRASPSAEGSPQGEAPTSRNRRFPHILRTRPVPSNERRVQAQGPPPTVVKDELRNLRNNMQIDLARQPALPDEEFPVDNRARKRLYYQYRKAMHQADRGDLRQSAFHRSNMLHDHAERVRIRQVGFDDLSGGFRLAERPQPTNTRTPMSQLEQRSTMCTRSQSPPRNTQHSSDIRRTASIRVMSITPLGPHLHQQRIDQERLQSHDEQNLMRTRHSHRSPSPPHPSGDQASPQWRCWGAPNHALQFGYLHSNQPSGSNAYHHELQHQQHDIILDTLHPALPVNTPHHEGLAGFPALEEMHQHFQPGFAHSNDPMHPPPARWHISQPVLSHQGLGQHVDEQHRIFEQSLLPVRESQQHLRASPQAQKHLNHLVDRFLAEQNAQTQNQHQSPGPLNAAHIPQLLPAEHQEHLPSLQALNHCFTRYGQNEPEPPGTSHDHHAAPSAGLLSPAQAQPWPHPPPAHSSGENWHVLALHDGPPRPAQVPTRQDALHPQPFLPSDLDWPQHLGAQWPPQQVLHQPMQPPSRNLPTSLHGPGWEVLALHDRQGSQGQLPQ